MKYVFLNPQSCSGMALSKWSKVSLELDLSDAIIVDNFYSLDWEKFRIQKGDTFISAGGDGTLHCMVNSLVKHKGSAILALVKIGHIGLGSNNSFLRPYSECQLVNDIPMKISDISYIQDLMEIEVINGLDSKKVYCIANSSLGFLATANILFNSSSDIAILKKWNSDLADIYTFLKALIKWKPITISYEFNKTIGISGITNMHFMKKSYYATDLGFPEVINPTGGYFRLNTLWQRSRLVILKKFFSMLVFKNLVAGRDMTMEIAELKIKSESLIPIEMDGEIYYGSQFNIRIFKEGIHLCR